MIIQIKSERGEDDGRGESLCIVYTIYSTYTISESIIVRLSVSTPI